MRNSVIIVWTKILGSALLLSVFCIQSSISGEEQDSSSKCSTGKCIHSNEVEHEKMKYSKDQNRAEHWKKYLQLIEQANRDYIECSADDCYQQQRRSDYREWTEKGGITEEEFTRANKLQIGNHYQIIDHKLYRSKDCYFPSRCEGNEHFLLRIIDRLPNMEFVVNCHDWPKARIWSDAMPVFSFSKTPTERDFMYPAWTFWAGGPAVWPIFPTGLGRWDLMSENLIKTSEEWPWQKKHSIAYFRGSRTSAERDPLVLLSRDRPDLVNAQYTKNQAWTSPKDTLDMPAAEPVTMEEHCKYKYLFNFRGVAASFRFKHLFLCKSLVFHVGDEWTEFFYSEMKPWVHYIPVSTELTEVQELLEFARENDDVVQQIVERGFNFITSHLQLEDIEDYWLKTLTRYAELTKWAPIHNETLKEIKMKT